MVRCTLPDFRHEVQTQTRFLVPFTIAFTFCTLGDQWVLVCLLEWLTLLPDITPLPQISQYFAITHTSFRYVVIKTQWT